MTTVRRVIREKAFQSLFQLATNKESSKEEAIKQALKSDLETEEEMTVEEALKQVLPQEKRSNNIIQDGLAYLNVLVAGVLNHEEEIDEKIAQHLKKGWSISRLERTNLLILRLATYELFFQPDIDPRIVMNEAIELTKSFNDDQSSKFVNGVLQSIKNTKEA